MFVKLQFRSESTYLMMTLWAFVLGVVGFAEASRSGVEAHRASVLRWEKSIPVVEHDKVAGNGYLPGSPLYRLEQRVKLQQTKNLEAVGDADRLTANSLWEPPVVEEQFRFPDKFPDNPEEVYAIWLTHWQFMTGELLASFLISTLVGVFIILCCAFAYTKIKVDPIIGAPPRDGLDHEAYLLDKNDWRFGLCDCMQTPLLCFLSTCCPAIRWADTMRLAGFLGFYAAVLLMSVLFCLNPITSGVTSLVMLCIAVRHRQSIRRIFGMPAGDASTYCQDCCAYMCCSCCAIVQEARQVEEAYGVNHPVVRLMAPKRQDLR